MTQTPEARREFYLIRHAQTDMNVRPELVGGRSSHARLTEVGRGQATQLGRALLRAGILPTYVHSSPAIRCLETARLSLAELIVTGEPEVQDALQELSQGAAEGQLRTDIYTSETLAEIGRRGKDFALPGGESMNQVGRRMYDWMRKMNTMPTAVGRTERIFVYTHGGTIKYLASHLEDWTHARSYATEIGNATLNLFVAEDDEFSVAYLNRTAEEL